LGGGLLILLLLYKLNSKEIEKKKKVTLWWDYFCCYLSFLAILKRSAFFLVSYPLILWTVALSFSNSALLFFKIRHYAVNQIRFELVNWLTVQKVVQILY
jgi:hypothetical protein